MEEKQGITNEDIFNFNFYTYGKPFTGSYKGMRYRIIKEDGETPQFHVTVWPEPLSFDAVPEEQKENCFFEFSEEGKALVMEWLNEKKKNFSKKL